MASDAEAPSKKRASLASDKSAKEDFAVAVRVGDAVLVQSTEDRSAFLAAKVVRKHMSGEFTVEYSDTGKTEKYVKPDRVQLKKRTGSKAKPVAPAFQKGDRVLYRAEDTKKKWRNGVVKMCREDGTFDILDEDSEGVIKKVPAADVKPSVSEKNEGTGSEREEWKTGDRVEFQTGKKWRRGRIEKIRKDGMCDISHESDEEEIAEKVPHQKIRHVKAKSSKDRKKASDDDEEEEADEKASASIRKRKSKRKASAHSEDDDDSEKNGGSDSTRNKHARRKPRSGVRFEQLRLLQVVEFLDERGRSHRGYIKVLRKQDQECDIEHESNTDQVSKRVPVSDISTVSVLSRLWGPSRNAQAYQLNSRVYYRTKEGIERKGFVVKICRDEGKNSSSQPTYDIEDEIEGDVIRKVPASKLRPVPWINYPSVSFPTLPSLPGLPSMPAMPSMPSMPSWTILRKGMQVRVRLRDEDSKRVHWEDGVILKLKKDATCVVECVDSDGSRSKVTVKNGDVRPKFSTPFAGITLPTLRLPQGLHPPKSSVEVLAEGKSNVYMGTIVSVNEAEKTYTILYADGHKEKNVASHRVRLCLRKLRIGTEVEMIVEGPCKEVSKLDGEVAWVHRDEKVAVRINGGNNDVFAEVCTHAIMVDGQPAFAAPLSTTWVEMGSFYANLSLELLAFLWLCFGLCVEIGEMTRLRDETVPELLGDPHYMAGFYLTRQTDWQACPHRPTNGTYLTFPASFMLTDRAWLLAMIVLKILLAIACVFFSCQLVHNKISAIQDNYIDVKEFQRDRVLRNHFSRVLGFTIVVCFLTLLVYASLINRFDFFCLLTSDSLKFDNLSLHVNIFAVHTEYPTTIELVLALAAKSVFNVFRAIALHLLVFAFPNTGIFVRVCFWLPVCITVTALVSSMGIAGLHIFYYIQREDIVKRGIPTMTAREDWALMAVIVALWFGVTIVRLLVAAGTYFDTMHTRQVNSRGDVTEDLLDQAERGEFGLQAKQEALHSRVELKQEQLGICKLSVLRVQQHLFLHFVGMVVGIIATCILRGTVEDDAITVQAALTLHLVLCIVWLIIVILASMLAVAIKREAPELLTYILDV